MTKRLEPREPKLSGITDREQRINARNEKGSPRKQKSKS